MQWGQLTQLMRWGQVVTWPLGAGNIFRNGHFRGVRLVVTGYRINAPFTLDQMSGHVSGVFAIVQDFERETIGRQRHHEVGHGRGPLGIRLGADLVQAGLAVVDPR